MTVDVADLREDVLHSLQEKRLTIDLEPTIVLELLDRIADLEDTVDEQRSREAESNSLNYLHGLKDGITRYAWWKNGVQFVGTTGTTLKQALEAVDKTRDDIDAWITTATAHTEARP